MQSVEFVFKIDYQNAVVLAEKAVHILGLFNSDDCLYLSGKEVEGPQIARHVSKDSGFVLENDSFDIRMGTLPNQDLRFMIVKQKKTTVSDWYTPWIQNLIVVHGFLQAWLVASEYSYWQNAENILQYESKGKSYQDLRLKSNGLPFPLEEQVIDISDNPGLRKFCDGYIEAIGAQMWFTSEFLSMLGKSIKDVQEKSDAVIDVVRDRLFYLHYPCEVFKDSETLTQQRKLRAALYGS